MSLTHKTVGLVDCSTSHAVLCAAFCFCEYVREVRQSVQVFGTQFEYGLVCGIADDAVHVGAIMTNIMSSLILISVIASSIAFAPQFSIRVVSYPMPRMSRIARTRPCQRALQGCPMIRFADM